MLRDCTGRAAVRACARCGDVVPTSQLAEHMASRSCAALRPGQHRCGASPAADPSERAPLTARPAAPPASCPLCKDVFSDPPGDDGWMAHLVDRGCPASDRRGAV